MIRKYITYLIAILTLLIIVFFVWSWFFPIHIGYKSESPVGFYRFNIVWWELSNGKSFYVIEELGDTWDYIKYLLGLHDPLQ